MRFLNSCLRLLPALVLGTPWIASAQAFAQSIGLFNVFVGVMLTAALLSYATGLIVWLIRLGTWPTYRTEAIKIMEWSVVILFVLVILLAIVQFFRDHPRMAGYILTSVILVLIVGVIIHLAAKSEGKEKKKEEGRPPMR